jgi:hypothetical protein
MGEKPYSDEEIEARRSQWADADERIRADLASGKAYTYDPYEAWEDERRWLATIDALRAELRQLSEWTDGIEEERLRLSAQLAEARGLLEEAHRYVRRHAASGGPPDARRAHRCVIATDAFLASTNMNTGAAVGQSPEPAGRPGIVKDAGHAAPTSSPPAPAPGAPGDSADVGDALTPPSDRHETPPHGDGGAGGATTFGAQPKDAPQGDTPTVGALVEQRVGTSAVDSGGGGAHKPRAWLCTGIEMQYTSMTPDSLGAEPLYARPTLEAVAREAVETYRSVCRAIQRHWWPDGKRPPGDDEEVGFEHRARGASQCAGVEVGPAAVVRRVVGGEA